MQVTIIGCGDIGERVAKILLAQKIAVNTLVRRSTRAEYLNKLNFNATKADLDQEDSAQIFDKGAKVIWFSPPPSTGCKDHRIRRWLKNIESKQLPEKIVYISTSGVYGDCSGAWVDELTPVNPQADRSKRRLDAEQQLVTWCKQQQVPYVILRVAGIYGEGRWPLERIRRGNPVVKKDEAAFSNRIHQDDLAQACVAALLRDEAQGVINVSDGQPSTMSDYFQQIAKVFSLPALEEITLQQAKQQLSPAMISYLTESRRIDNRKMLKLLEIRLKYPTLEAALATMKV